MVVRRAYSLSSLSEKTRKSNRLQMSLQRPHFLLSYWKTRVSSPVLKQQPLTRQTGAYPIELTGGFSILVVVVVVVFIGKLNCKEDFFWADVELRWYNTAGSVRRFVSPKRSSIMSRQFDVSKRKLNEQLKKIRKCVKGYYFEMILSECGETSTKHSSCLLELKDKQRRAISINGTVTWKKKLTLFSSRTSTVVTSR